MPPSLDESLSVIWDQVLSDTDCLFGQAEFLVTLRDRLVQEATKRYQHGRVRIWTCSEFRAQTSDDPEPIPHALGEWGGQWCTVKRFRFGLTEWCRGDGLLVLVSIADENSRNLGSFQPWFLFDWSTFQPASERETGLLDDL